jgi:hypothetical protein
MSAFGFAADCRPATALQKRNEFFAAAYIAQLRAPFVDSTLKAERLKQLFERVASTKFSMFLYFSTRDQKLTEPQALLDQVKAQRDDGESKRRSLDRCHAY